MLALTGASVSYYDCLLTFDKEVARYWKRPITWPAGLYFANRYVALIGQVPVILGILIDWSERVAFTLLLSMLLSGADGVWYIVYRRKMS